MSSEQTSTHTSSVVLFSEALLVTLVLALVCFFADFFYVSDFGLLIDDWGHVGARVWSDVSLKNTLLSYWAGDWEGRPAWAFNMAIHWIGARLFGVTGCFLAVWLFLSLAALLFYRLLRYRWSWQFSLFCALLFVLAPHDTTHDWGVMLGQRTAMVMSLLAICAWSAGRPMLSLLSLMGAVFTYEQSIFVFFLAGILIEPPSLQRYREVLRIFFAALVAYLLYRVLLFPAGGGDARISILHHEMQQAGYLKAIGLYLFNFPYALFTTCIGWPLMAVAEVYKRMGNVSSLIMLVLTILLIPLVKYTLLTAKRDEEVVQTASRTFLAPLVQVLAGASLSLWAYPSLTMTVDSRYNYFLQPGGILFISLCILFAARGARGSVRLNVLSVVCSCMLVTFFLFRLFVQEEWRNAGITQKEVLAGFVEAAGRLPQGAAVIFVDVPVRRDGESIGAFLPPATWEMGAAFRLLYSADIRPRVLRPGASLETAIAETTERDVLIYYAGGRAVRWVKRSEADATAAPKEEIVEFLKTYRQHL